MKLHINFMEYIFLIAFCLGGIKIIRILSNYDGIWNMLILIGIGYYVTLSAMIIILNTIKFIGIY